MGIFDIFNNEETEDDSLEFFNIETDEEGFTITNQNDVEYYNVKWEDVGKVYFPTDHQTVEVELNSGDKIIITHEFSNWPLFLKAVPASFKEFDLKLVDSFFATLKACKVCGLLAVHDEICEHCGNGVYDEDIDGPEYENEAIYNKEMQSNFFEGEIKPDKDTIFKVDKDWKALITQSELDAYNNEDTED